MASPGTFLRYSLLQTLKNSRRTFSAVIGVTLAVTLVAAENISVDSSARAVMDALLDGVPVDFMARTSVTGEPAAVASALSRVGLVERVEPISGNQYSVLVRPSGGGPGSLSLNLSGVEPSFGEVASRFGLSGAFRLSLGGIVISENLSAAAGVAVGQALALEGSVFLGYNRTTGSPEYGNNTVVLNVTAVVSHQGVPTAYEIVNEAPSLQNLEGRTNPARYGEMGRYFKKESAAFVPLGELGGIVARLNEGSGPEQLKLIDDRYNHTFHYCVWTQRHSVLNAFDTDGSSQSLAKLEQRLALAGDMYSIDIFENNLQPVLERTSQSSQDARTKYLAFSLPVVFLGLYLGVLGVDLGMAGRRREVALLKSRGATPRHVFWLFLGEGLFLGIIAGAAGLVLGTLTSAVLFEYFVPAASGLGPSLYLTGYSAALAMFLGVLLMLAAMYRPARRAARLEVSEGLHYYSSEESTERYNPRNAVLMTSVAVILYLAIVLFDPQKWYSEGRPLDAVYYILSILRVAGTALSWLIPLLFIFGLTGLLTRASYRPYGLISGLTRPLTRELRPVVERNIVRNPKRASRVCVIIAVAITFGILVTTWAATESDHQQALSRVIVGADLRAVFSSSGTTNTSIGEAVGALPHVRAVSMSYLIEGASIVGGGIDLVALEARGYSAVAYLDDRLFLEGSPRDVPSLAGGKRMIINQALQAQTSARAGDTVNLKIPTAGHGQPILMGCRIVAVVSALPGMVGEAYSGYIQNLLPAAYIDEGNLDLESVGVHQINAFVQSDDPVQAAREIRAAFPEPRLDSVLVEREYLEELQTGPVSVSDYRFLLIESGFAVVIVTAGLGLILAAAVYERQKETAGWMARGATRRQVASIFVAEALTLLVLALAVGVVAGFMTAGMALGLFGQSGVDPVGRSLVVPLDTLWLMAATVGSLLLTSYAVSWKASRVELAQVLRLRGG